MKRTFCPHVGLTTFLLCPCNAQRARCDHVEVPDDDCGRVVRYYDMVLGPCGRELKHPGECKTSGQLAEILTDTTDPGTARRMRMLIDGLLRRPVL